MASKSDESEVSPSSSESGHNDLSLPMRLTVGGIRTRFPSVKRMSTKTLHDLILNEKDAVQPRLILLDTRPQEEYNISHIAGAIHVDPGEKVETVLNVVHQILKDNQGNSSSPEHQAATVVCYCSVGYRSSTMVQKLAKATDSQCKGSGNTPHPHLTFCSLEGSLFKWANEERPMVDSDDKATVFAHPYNKVFGKLLNSHLRKYPTKPNE